MCIMHILYILLCVMKDIYSLKAKFKYAIFLATCEYWK